MASFRQWAASNLIPWLVRRAGALASGNDEAPIRAVGERAMAALKGWRLLRKQRCSPTRITNIVKAALTPHLTSA